MIRNRFARFYAPADDATNLGGGGAVDRGDGLSAEQSAAADVAAAAAAEKAAAADAVAAAEKAATDKADADAAAAEAAAVARDDKGRFKKGDDKDDAGADKKMIPKARFDEQVAKERARTLAAEARAAELEKQIKQVAHSEDIGRLDEEISAIADKLEAARLDGNKEAVKTLASELRMKERQVSIAENTRMSAAAKDQAREEMRLDLTIEKLEGLHPMLNESDKDNYDQDVVDMVLATQRDLIQRERLSPSVALEEATRKVMLKVMPKHVEDVPDDDKGGLKGAKDAKDDDRKKQQVQKNIDTALKQPASMKESGADADKHGQTKEDPNASDMTFDEFAALPEATKARMRGDII